MEDYKGRDYMENLGISRMMILRWIIKEISRNGVDWLQLIHHSVQCWTVLNIVIH